LRKTRKYRLAERVGSLNKLGTVKIVFTRRRGERTHIALVTDDLNSSMRSIVTAYLKRWSIEMPISKLKERMRRVVWKENVQDVIKYSHEKPVIRRLEKLLAS
jgi:hypothetical protein